MDKYYYVISQLPVLFFDKDTFMTIDYFLEETQKWLTPTDYNILSNVNINSQTWDKQAPKLLQEIVQVEHNFRSELALWRKSMRAGQEYKPTTFSLALVKEGNPLDIEKKILKSKWDYLEEKEHDHHFDLEFLIIYLMKLQILHKLSIFSKEKGMENFQNISKVTI